MLEAACLCLYAARDELILFVTVPTMLAPSYNSLLGLFLAVAAARHLGDNVTKNKTDQHY
jgi:hypothetical protein